MLKKLIAVILFFGIAISGISVWAAGGAADAVSVKVINNDVTFPDAKPFIDANNRTLVPLRPIAEALGMEVEWKEDTEQAVFTKTFTNSSDALCVAPLGDESIIYYLEKYEVIFTIGSKDVLVKISWAPADGVWVEEATKMFDRDYHRIPMDTEAIIVDNRTYAPVRYLAESAGCQVIWDAENNTVKIFPYYEVPATEAKPAAVAPSAGASAKPDEGNLPDDYMTREYIKRTYPADGWVFEDRGLKVQNYPGEINILYQPDYKGVEIADIFVTSVSVDDSPVDILRESYMENISNPKSTCLANVFYDKPDGVDYFHEDALYSMEYTVFIEYTNGDTIYCIDTDHFFGPSGM